jgi:K+-transporting ATPase ATPase B chain
MNHSKHTVQTQQNTIASTLFQAEAWKNAFIKLLPQHVIKNPVMAIVWLGTLITLVSTILGQSSLVFGLLVTLILFVTVLSANYAEAVAEAKGRGQASSLRQARQNLTARRIHSKDDMDGVQISAAELNMHDLIEVRAGN